MTSANMTRTGFLLGASVTALVLTTAFPAPARAQTTPTAQEPRGNNTDKPSDALTGGSTRAPAPANAPPGTPGQTTTGGTAPTQTAPSTIDPAAVNQDLTQPAVAPAAPQDDMFQGSAAGDILVTGVRQAEQTAISRKRQARTALDSIVADDVGQFPDKNAAEAISRIAGVALDVSDSNEQGGFTIRGQSADLIRVEVDGMTALPAVGGGDQGGRAAAVNDISSDLIKSVDVIKGQTADMTPGGVGGTVRIEQRTGLDFKKPLYRLNVQFRQDELNGRWSPRINAIATRKLFNDRVGLLANVTYEVQRPSTDFSRVADKGAGYVPYGDQDNSPEKSFVTPFDPRAAAVTTKAGCAALPDNNGINSRLNCYAQWEDFVPSLVRFGRGTRKNERLSAQLRADWRTTDTLTTFLSYNPNLNWVSSQDYNLSIASPSGTTTTAGALATNIRNVTVNPNHYVTQFDMVRGTGVGTVTSLNWTTQVRDIQRKNQQHYAQAGADWVSGPWIAQARVQYSYASGTREDRAFSFAAPLQSATFSLVPDSGLWTFAPNGNIDLANPQAYQPQIAANGRSATQQYEYTPFADKNSEWNYQLDVARSFDDFDWVKRVKFGAQYRDRRNNSYREGGFNIKPGVALARARSLDLVQYCNPQLAPIGSPCPFGSTRRNTAAGTTEQLYKIHTLTDYQYQEMIAGSLQQMPGRDFFNNFSGRGDLLRSWYAYDASKLQSILGKYADLSDHNLDCLYECIASDGNVYTRPTYSTDEMTASAYAMVDWETYIGGMLLAGNSGVRYQRIKVAAQPVVDFSNRVAIQSTTAGGLPTLIIQDQFVERTLGDVKRTSNDFLPSLNIALWPVENKLGLRYSLAAQRARPSITELTGTGAVQCGRVSPEDRARLEALIASNPGAIQDDNPDTDDGAESSGFLTSFNNRCSGRIGNPQLKGYGAITQNLSLEWYPNKDTQVTGAIYSIDVKSGRPESVTLSGYGLNGEIYDVPTYRDGPSGLKTTGWEVAARTAFTFLPWVFKYTGGGFNYSRSKTNQQNTDKDIFTGLSLPPRGQSAYYYNVNLWYDDGRLNARVAYQARAEYFSLIDAESINRIPATNGITGTTSTTSYFKYVSPIFRGKNETLDARAAYKITKSLQLFLEGKNLLRGGIPKFVPDKYRQIDDQGTPYLYDQLYAGRTYYAGLIASF